MFSLPVFGSKLWQVVVNFIPDPFLLLAVLPQVDLLLVYNEKFAAEIAHGDAPTLSMHSLAS